MFVLNDVSDDALHAGAGVLAVQHCLRYTVSGNGQMTCYDGLSLSGIQTTTSIIEAAGRVSCFGLETGGSLGINVWSCSSKTASITQEGVINGRSLSITGVVASRITTTMDWRVVVVY